MACPPRVSQREEEKEERSGTDVVPDTVGEVLSVDASSVAGLVEVVDDGGARVLLSATHRSTLRKVSFTFLIDEARRRRSPRSRQGSYSRRLRRREAWGLRRSSARRDEVSRDWNGEAVSTKRERERVNAC
jgi:hypothetical protein